MLSGAQTPEATATSFVEKQRQKKKIKTINKKFGLKLLLLQLPELNVRISGTFWKPLTQAF